MTTPQILIIGAGLVGQQHAKVADQMGCLAGFVEPFPATQAAVSHYRQPCFDTLDEAVANIGFDGAIIATPNNTHSDLARELIARNIPALIEKPICDSVKEAVELTKLAALENVPLLVGHHRRHNPIIKAAKEFIDAGNLGRITLVDSKFWLYKPADYFNQEWRTKEGAGPIYINLIHDIDLLRHLCGEILAVNTTESSAIREFEVEDTAVVTIEFSSGALGTLSLSDTTVAPWSWEFSAAENPAYHHVPGSAYKIGGTDASISLPDLTVWRHTKKKGWWEPIAGEALPVQHGSALEAQLIHFLAVIEGTEPPYVTGESATRSLAVIEAIKLSSKSGQRSKIDQILAAED